MKKNAVVFGCWFQSEARMDKYIDVLTKYYADCDIYIGINPTEYTQVFIDKLSNTSLSYFIEITPDNLIIRQHTSSTQSGLRKLIDIGIEYNLVHFIHTKGITYNDYHFERSFSDYILNYAKKRNKIELFLDFRTDYGAYADFGGIQPQWFIKNGIDIDNLHRPFDNINDSASNSLENYDLKIHPAIGLDDYFDFEYLPMRTQFLTGVYTFKWFLLRDFFKNTKIDILNKHLINDLKYDIYFFETHIAQISCRQGYLRYIENYWDIGFGVQDKLDKVIELYKEENNLL